MLDTVFILQAKFCDDELGTRPNLGKEWNDQGRRVYNPIMFLELKRQ